MSSQPEPTDVGPAVGGHLPLAAEHRDHAIRLIDAAYVDGRLTRFDYEQRRAAVPATRTFDDLVPLTRDLGPLPVPLAAAPVVPAPGVAFAPAPTGLTDLLLAIFGGAKRTGRFPLRRQVTALALFGSVDLDLTEAVWDEPACDMGVFCLFGGIDVRVPDGVEVRNQVVPIFGGSDVKGVTAVAAGMPVLTLRGLVGFGGVDVKGPLSGRRRKKQRREDGSA